MKLHAQYTKEVHDQLNYLATWLPTLKVAPGDVCTIQDYELGIVSTLSEFGIPFEVVEVTVATDIDYSSDRAVSVQLKAKGDPPQAGSMLTVEEAGITLSFNRSNAVAMRMAGCTSRMIKSVHKVGEGVMSLHAAKKWPEGYVVITQVVSAGASTIIISKGSTASIDLVAKGSAGKGPLTIASIDAGLQIKRESNIGAKFVATPGLTPLAVAAGIKKRFMRPGVFETTDVPESTRHEEFGSVDYADFVQS